MLRMASECISYNLEFPLLYKFRLLLHITLIAKCRSRFYCAWFFRWGKIVREINVSRPGDPVHAGDKALMRETPSCRRDILRLILSWKLPGKLLYITLFFTSCHWYNIVVYFTPKKCLSEYFHDKISLRISLLQEELKNVVIYNYK
jgi:hypothetical protein